MVTLRIRKSTVREDAPCEGLKEECSLSHPGAIYYSIVHVSKKYFYRITRNIQIPLSDNHDIKLIRNLIRSYMVECMHRVIYYTLNASNTPDIAKSETLPFICKVNLFFYALLIGLI